MTLLTIPQQLVQQKELVLISRKEYDQFVLHYGLYEAMREVKEGKVVGPFHNAKDLMKSLRVKQ